MKRVNTDMAHLKYVRRALVFILALSVIIAGMFASTTGEAEAKAETVTIRYGNDIWYGSEFNGYTSIKWVTHINGEAVDLDDIAGVSRSYAYCVQPLVFAPPAGTYSITVVDDDGSGKIAKMRKLIYYLPGSYGYTKTTKKKWFSGYSTNEAYALGHLALSWIYDNYTESNDVWGGAPSSMKNKVKDIVDDLKSLDEPPEDYEVFWVKVTGKQDVFGAFYSTEYGEAKLVKKSEMPKISKYNSTYSLKGAEYTVYKDSDCEEIAKTANGKIAVLKTDEDGDSNVITIETGDYYVKETKAPKGFTLDPKVRQITIKHNKTTTLTVQDKPKYSLISILLRKQDADSRKSKPQGDASLGGAVYKISYYDQQFESVSNAEASGEAKATWYFETDDKGEISGSLPRIAKGYTSSSLYEDSDGRTIFLLGTYIIQEIKAPVGYLINSEKILEHMTDDGSDEQIISAYNENASSSDTVIRGGVKISKIDNDLDEACAQGGASLAGAEFTIYNKSASSVFVGNNEIAKDSAALIIRTDASGLAESSADALPYGTYMIKETKASTGYLLNSAWSKTFQIREDGKIIDLSGDKVREAVERGGVQIVKRDKELTKSEALGGATIEGIEMTIKNVSGHDVVVRADIGSMTGMIDWKNLDSKRELFESGAIKRVKFGEDVGKIIVHWNEEKKAYTAETLTDDLPYGTYTIRESKTNNSYQRTDKTEHKFEIREDGTLYAYDSEDMESILTFDNYVYRSDLQGTKIGDGDSKRFSYVPFKITSVSNGETHVVVADKNGFFSTADRRTKDALDEDEASDDIRKHNPFDDLLGADEISIETIEERSGDIQMGVWFGMGEFGGYADMNSSFGALPYDSYIIEEIACKENEEYELQRFFFTIDEKSQNGLLDLETITNDYEDVPEIGTQAGVNGKNREVDPGAEITLVDVIQYSNLKKGETYTVKGRLIDKSTDEVVKDANGNDVVAEATFEAKRSNGKTKVTFVFDASNMAGMNTVVYENLYDANGSLIAKHEEKDNEDQTVTWKKETKPPVPVTTKEPKEPRSPKTGDDFGRNLLYCLLAMTASAEGLLLTKKRRNDRLN